MLNRKNSSRNSRSKKSRASSSAARPSSSESRSSMRSTTRASCNKSAPSAKQITKRIVNTKRHTTGYVVAGKTYDLRRTADRSSLLRLSKDGQIKGVHVVGRHIQSLPGNRRLSSLETEVRRD